MILVTGGTGLVGAHLLYQLIISGESPVALKRTSSDISKTKKILSYYSKDHETIFNKIEWIDGDILDYYSVLDAMDGIKNVYHAAASVSFQSSDKEGIISTNVTGTTNIVNAAIEKKVEKLIHVSSIGALGRATANGIVTEETYWSSKKSSVYSTSKYHAEMEVWRGIAEGLNAVIINPSIILGPGDWSTGSSKLFATMYNGLKFYSTGTNGFVDVEDVVRVMRMLMKSDITGKRFIINSENVSYKDFFSWMAYSLCVPRPKYKATRLLSEIAWRLLWMRGLLTGTKSTITRETAITANQNYYYSNNKITKEFNISFLSVKNSVKKNAAFFINDNNNSGN